jgi:hypothetical protein
MRLWKRPRRSREPVRQHRRICASIVEFAPASSNPREHLRVHHPLPVLCSGVPGDWNDNKRASLRPTNRGDICGRLRLPSHMRTRYAAVGKADCELRMGVFCGVGIHATTPSTQHLTRESGGDFRTILPNHIASPIVACHQSVLVRTPACVELSTDKGEI